MQTIYSLNWAFYELNSIQKPRIFAEERRVDAEYREKVNRQPAGTRFVPDFNHFWNTLEINNYLTHLLAFHNDICSTEVVGFSHQGQLMRALSISLRGRGRIDGSRPIVFVDAGIHAREWAAHTTTIHMIYQLVERRNEYLDILNNVDFVFLPVVNPDGFDHSRLNVRADKIITWILAMLFSIF